MSSDLGWEFIKEITKTRKKENMHASTQTRKKELVQENTQTRTRTRNHPRKKELAQENMHENTHSYKKASTKKRIAQEETITGKKVIKK